MMKSRKNASDTVFGVVWYSQNDWMRIKATADDPDRFEETFADWIEMANENFELVQKRLPSACKVLIAADEFFLWCHLRGKHNNADGRSEFVAEKVRTTKSDVAY